MVRKNKFRAIFLVFFGFLKIKKSLDLILFEYKKKTVADVLMTVRSHWKCASGVVGDEIDDAQSLIKTFRK